MTYLLIYIILTALSAIFRHLVGLNMPNMLMIFLSTTIAILVYSVLCLKNLPQVYKFMLKNKYDYIASLVFVMIIWVGSFLNPVYFSPAIHLFTFMIIPPILSGAFAYLKHRTNYHLIRTVTFLLNLLVFYYILHFRYTDVKFMLLIIATAITGIAAFLYFKVSEKFNKQDIKPVEILASRFWLLWLISLVGSIHNHDFVGFKAHYLLLGIAVGIISLIIPIYFLQKSIQKVGADASVMYVGLTPFLCFALQEYIFHIDFGFEYVCSIVYVLTIILFYLKLVLDKRRVIR